MVAGGRRAQTASLRQAVVPNHLLGRVVSAAMVLAWSAIPVGAFVGGLAIKWTHDVRLAFVVCGLWRGST
jgi:hypothetical protein